MALIPGSLKERTMEGLLLEIAMIIQKIEANELFNPDKKNLVNVIIDSDTKIASITARLPIDYFTGMRGEQIYKARQYMHVDQVVPAQEFMYQPD